MPEQAERKLNLRTTVVSPTLVNFDHAVNEALAFVDGKPKGIGQLLDWNPGSAVRAFIGDDLNPSPYASSVSGTLAERSNMHDAIMGFVNKISTRIFVRRTFGSSVNILVDEKLGIPGTIRPERGITNNDATLMFVVIDKKGDPVAGVGFHEYPDGVEIRTIQQVKPTSAEEELATRKNMVTLVERYARKRGHEQVMIIPAHMHPDVSLAMDENAIATELETAQRIYDDIANEKNYRYEHKLKRYIKKINIEKKLNKLILPGLRKTTH